MGWVTRYEDLHTRYPTRPAMGDESLHTLLDTNYGPLGDEKLRAALADGLDPDEHAGPTSETALHTAARRRRCSAVNILLDHGVDIDARNGGGKTAYAHAIRRGFHDVATILTMRGSDTSLDAADRFAVAIINGRLDEARKLLASDPSVARTGNPEEDRLLADIAGRNPSEPVALLIEAGADLAARGLDDGTPLHQAAWFGQPQNARLLIEAGAPLDVFDRCHESSPLHWAIHGSRYSGGAADRQDVYLVLTRMLLEAGSSLYYPDNPKGTGYIERMLRDASPRVKTEIESFLIQQGVQAGP